MTKMIFVYGSLMTNFWNHNKSLKGHVIHSTKGQITGTLYHLANKGYPGFIPTGHNTVYGEILSVNDYEEVLKKMDNIEGYCGFYHSQNPYNRCKQEVKVYNTNQYLELDVYIYNPDALDNLMDQRIALPQGNWSDYMEQEDAIISNIDKVYT